MQKHTTYLISETEKLKFKLLQELAAQVKWLNERDKKKESLRMQGAKYAYLCCIKRLKKL